MLRRFLNTSEYKTLGIIKKSLKETSYTVSSSLPLYIIFSNDNNIFDREEMRYIQRATFDFVVFDDHSLPTLAIEFDGPVHDIYEKKKLSDIKKNRICMKEGLPLIRIKDFHLEEYEKMTILEYIILRFVRWNLEQDQILEEINKFLSGLAEKDAKSYFRDGIMDPSIDPTVIFDLKYPFPGIKKIKKRIYTNYGISESNISWGKQKVISGDDGSITYKETRHLTATIINKKNKIQQEIDKIFSVEINLLSIIPTEKDWDPTESVIEYLKRYGKSPITFNDVPGLSVNALAETLSEYFVFKKIESWLEGNIQKTN